MGIGNRFRSVLSGVVLLAVLAPGAGCLVAAGAGVYGGYRLGTDPRSAGEIIDDDVVTAKVKARLIEEPGVRALNIDVDTREGEVTLSGYVASEEQAERVLGVAAGVHGVTRVVSRLKIRR